MRRRTHVTTSRVSSRRSHVTRVGKSRTSASATSWCRPSPTTCNVASGTRDAASRHASAIAWRFLYRSRTPMNSAVGRSGSGSTGGSENAVSSVYVVNTPAGSTPASRTIPVVKGESVRTASALRTATRAARSASGATTRTRRRAVEAGPRAPVAVDLDHDGGVASRERCARRSAASASYGLCARIASAGARRSSRAMRRGSEP